MFQRILNYHIGDVEKLNPVAAFLCVIFAVIILFGTGIIVVAAAFGSIDTPLLPTVPFGLLVGGVFFYTAYRKWVSQKENAKQIKRRSPQDKPLPERATSVVAKLNFLAWVFVFFVFVKTYQFLFIN